MHENAQTFGWKTFFYTVVWIARLNDAFRSYTGAKKIRKWEKGKAKAYLFYSAKSQQRFLLICLEWNRCFSSSTLVWNFKWLNFFHRYFLGHVILLRKKRKSETLNINNTCALNWAFFFILALYAELYFTDVKLGWAPTSCAAVTRVHCSKTDDPGDEVGISMRTLSWLTLVICITVKSSTDVSQFRATL